MSAGPFDGSKTYPYGSRPRGYPVSLVSPEASDADDRRAYVVTSANGVPGPTDEGIATRGHRYIHGTLKVTAGTTVGCRLWFRPEFSDEWQLDTRLGVAGEVTVLTIDPDNPKMLILEIAGLDRVYVELLNFGGGETVEVWLAGASHV